MIPAVKVCLKIKYDTVFEITFCNLNAAILSWIFIYISDCEVKLYDSVNNALYFYLGKIQTLENFILRISALVADKRISIYIQQEVRILFNIIFLGF